MIKNILRSRRKSGRKEKVSLAVVTLTALSVGIAVLALNFVLFAGRSQVYAVVNLVGAFIILGAPVIYKYNEYRDIRNIESVFPRYLRDIAENIATGMTLPQAMRATRSTDYGAFTAHAKEISAKVSWGIPIEKALYHFAKKTKSKTLSRTVQAISETYKSGGTIDTILKSVAQSLQEMEKIKKERYSSVYAQMINGYLIYVIFLGVMIGLSTILIPTFTRFGTEGQDFQPIFIEIFRALTIIQGFFAGLAIGKMAEGTMIAGLKHAFALVIFGYSALLLFT